MLSRGSQFANVCTDHDRISAYGVETLYCYRKSALFQDYRLCVPGQLCIRVQQAVEVPDDHNITDIRDSRPMLWKFGRPRPHITHSLIDWL